jgi:hypothetical protein
MGDLVAYDLVRQHFHVLNEIVAAEAGARLEAAARFVEQWSISGMLMRRANTTTSVSDIVAHHFVEGLGMVTN